MGQQTNKIQKRRRREAYVKRKHEAAKLVSKAKPVRATKAQAAS